MKGRIEEKKQQQSEFFFFAVATAAAARRTSTVESHPGAGGDNPPFLARHRSLLPLSPAPSKHPLPCTPDGELRVRGPPRRLGMGAGGRWEGQPRPLLRVWALTHMPPQANLNSLQVIPFFFL